MDDPDQTIVMPRVIARSDPPQSSWSDRDAADVSAEAGPASDGATGLASLSFITAAIRRRRRLWSATALLGLLMGVGIFLTTPPSYQATTDAYLTLGPNEDPGTAINTDVALAQSRPVAAQAVQQLGLKESPDALLASYTATELTNRIVQFSLTASSSSGAASAANAVTAAFLQFRAEQLRTYQRLMISSLNQQIAAAKAQAAHTTNQITLSTLLNQQQSAQATQQTTQTETDTAVRGSYTIGAASVTGHSRTKAGALDALTGLVAGLVVGICYVAVAALLSDRLRARDDIAHALGTSVRLSVGPVRRRRLLRGRDGLAAVDLPDVRRISGHLRGRLADSARGNALAVVPADSDDMAALAVVALALSCAQSDKRVIVADLCPGGPAARLLGVAEPGVHHVDVQGTTLVAVMPEPGDAVPAGPLQPDTARTQATPGHPDLAALYSGADVLLAVAALDPMLGSEHLATWAADAVVMVTAGKSSWTKVQAVGEMLRLAGLRIVSAVLVGADKTDDSLGIVPAPAAARDAGADDDLSVGPLARSGS